MTVKRYDFGTEYRGNTGVPGIVGKVDGQYVRYEDYAALLAKVEAIGSGGVIGQRLTSDRQRMGEPKRIKLTSSSAEKKAKWKRTLESTLQSGLPKYVRRDVLQAIKEIQGSLDHAPQPAEPAKCDGDHAAPLCDDPRCWHDSTVRVPSSFPTGTKYSVEPHGNGYAIYQGRDNFHHGLNLAHLTECTPEFSKRIESALNAMSGPVKVLSDDEDYITEFLSEHADHNVEHGRMTFDKWSLRGAVRALIDRYGDIAPQPAGPVKGPSRDDILMALTSCKHSIESEKVILHCDGKQKGNALSQAVDRVVALLARYGHPATPDGWQQLPDHLGEMPKGFGEWFAKNYPGPETIIHDPSWHAPRIWRAAVHHTLKAAPKFGEEH